MKGLSDKAPDEMRLLDACQVTQITGILWWVIYPIRCITGIMKSTRNWVDFA